MWNQRSSTRRAPAKFRRRNLFPIVLIILFFSFTSFFLTRKGLDEDHEPRKRVPENVLPEKIPEQDLWIAPFSFGLHPCIRPTSKYEVARVSDHFLTVRSNGGLNQMRTGISDMVAVARIMNATLVIPQLDRRSFWKDTSAFSDIFDQEYFVEALRGDVRVVKALPKELESVPHARKHFTSWASVAYYEEMSHLWNQHQFQVCGDFCGAEVTANIYPELQLMNQSSAEMMSSCALIFFIRELYLEMVLLEVIHVAKSDSRLANNDLPLDIQRLRCRALYHALRFSPPIEILGKKLVERLRDRGGQYIALHLRYEKDMLSFTGCTYGLTEAESEELRIMREGTSHWKIKKINSTEQRSGGFCPLTPKEVGIFLQALGYPASTLIYVASGEIYGGHARLLELSSRFQNLIFKETLATKEELEALSNHASQAAAIDYIISVESDVFVASYSGNMARAVEGHRRFLGHRKTINPDRKGLVHNLDKLESGQLSEGTFFARTVREMHENRQGAPRKRRGPSSGIKGRARFRTEESFYENPYPECICRRNQKHAST